MLVLALTFALVSSIAAGSADFSGGLAARRATALGVAAIAAPVSLAAELLYLPLLGASWSGEALAWGAASGLAGAAASLLVYRTLAIGPMSVLSPITALASAVLLVLAGLATGEVLEIGAVAGILVGLGAVVLISTSSDGAGARPTSTGLLLACGAGMAIAVQLVCLERSPADSGLAPVVAARAVTAAAVLLAVVAVRRQVAARPPVAIAVLAGVLDSIANLTFLLATRQGHLVLVAVVTALYPAATVLLARVLLRERLRQVQLAGLAGAAAAVGLLAVYS